MRAIWTFIIIAFITTSAVEASAQLKYTITRSAGITYTPVSGSATTVTDPQLGFSDDDEFGPHGFFTFNYDGDTTSIFTISSNGYLALGGNTYAGYYLNSLTDGTATSVLAPFWEDLYLDLTLSDVTIKYEITGTAPSRILTVQWQNVAVINYPGPRLNFQVKLYESDSHIEYVYGVMQGFDGLNPNNSDVANGYAFSYTLGLTGANISSPATASQAIGLQQANSTSFSSLGGASFNEGLNKLSVLPECYTKYTFTPSLTVRSNDPYPGVPAAPSNDDPVNAITLTALPTDPNDYCGSFYSSAFATATSGVAPAVPGTNADDDVWFKFTAISTNTKITVRGSGGFDAVVQLFQQGALTTVLASKNVNDLTGTSLTETILPVDFPTVVGTTYYIRIYHAGGGTQATATATVTSGAISGFTIGNGGSGYITCNAGILFAGSPPDYLEASPFVYITDPTGAGAVASLTISGGSVTGINILDGGAGYTSPTVTIAPSGHGVTGDFSVIVNAVEGDEPCDAVSLSCITQAGNTSSKTASANAACVGTPDDDTWYKWVATTTTDVISIQGGTGFDAAVQVFSSSNNTCSGTFTSLSCINSTGTGGLETYTGSGLTIGNTYFVRVYHAASGAGTGAFTIMLNNNSNVWKGVNTAWTDASNWSCGTVPTSISNVIIPSFSNQPSISSGSVTINNLSLLSGASLSVSSATLALQGTPSTSGGTITATNGTISFTGTTAQTISAGLFNTNTVKSLTINNTAGVTQSGTLAITDVLTVAAGAFTVSNLILKSTSTNTAKVATVGGTISGDVTVERYIPVAGTSSQRAWRLLTAPVKGSSNTSVYYNWQNAGAIVTGTGVEIWGPSGSGIATGPGYSFRKYTASTNTYDPISNTINEPLFTGTSNNAFLTFVSGPYGSGNISSGAAATTLKAKGSLITGTKTFSFTPAGTNGANNFYLVGNPYACPIDFDKVLANTGTSNIISSFTIIDPKLNTVGGYVTLSKSGSSWISSVVTSDQNQYIQNGQAFFVQAASNALASVSFEENDKEISATQTNVFRLNGGLTENIRLNLMAVPSSNVPVVIDGAVVTCNESFSNTLAPGEDAPKFLNFNESISISKENNKLSIESRSLYDNGDSLKIALNGMRQSNFQLEIAPSNMAASGITATLYDSYLNSSQVVSLGSNTTYSFSVNNDPASAASDRFFLVFNNATPLDGNNISLQAFERDTEVDLTWQIANEGGIVDYGVEKSIDGKNFTELSKVSADGRAHYTAVDNDPSERANYYRVKARMASGGSLYSKVLLVNVDGLPSQLNIYPNPSTQSTIQLHLSGVEPGDYVVSLYSVNGQLVVSKQLTCSGASLTGTLEVGTLAAGVYQLKLTDKAGNTIAEQKLIRE
jgi:hypothetical protein